MFKSLIASVVVLLSSFNSTKNNLPVHKTFCHDYGLEMTEEEFLTHGGYGFVTSLDQNGITYVSHYSNNLLDGDTTVSFPNSKIIQHKKGFKAGILKSEVFYYDNSIPRLSIEYIGDGIIEKLYWYLDGSPMRKEEWVSGALIRAKCCNIRQEIDAEVINGCGVINSRDPEGALLDCQVFIQGKINSKKVFDGSNIVVKEISYKNNLKDGPSIIYGNDGNVIKEENWQCGNKNGDTKIFEGGQLVAVIPYKNNLKHGVEKNYVNGRLFKRISWKKGMLHGKLEQFDEYENAIAVEYYILNKMIPQTFIQSASFIEDVFAKLSE